MSGTMKRVTVDQNGKDNELLAQRAGVLAKCLREANTGGVTRWLDLEDRLDYMDLSENANYRRLLRLALVSQLSRENIGAILEGDEMRVAKAKELLKALNDYEEILASQPNSGEEEEMDAA